MSAVSCDVMQEVAKAISGAPRIFPVGRAKFAVAVQTNAKQQQEAPFIFKRGSTRFSPRAL
jgi:hypothetical protein